MPKLTQPAIDRCANVARAIDEELQKPIKERKSLYIRTPSPKSFKAQLGAYKTTFRQEWKGQFWMLVHDGSVRSGRDHPIHGRCLEIQFMQDGMKRVAYEIVRDNEDQIEIYREDVGALHTSSFTMTEAQQLTDSQAAHYILVESPINMKLELSFLEKDTLSYMDDPINVEPSALIRMLTKQGYNFERRGIYLWIHRGEE